MTSRKPATLLDPALIERFRHEGYVVVPNLLTKQEIDHYQVVVRDAVARRKQHDTRPLSEKSMYEQSFLQCMNLWEDFPAVRPLTFHPKVAQAAAELIGAHAVRLWHDQALFKEPGGRETDPHQDLPYWPMTETDAVTAWIPFDGSTHAMGCLGYVPGSHRIGVRKFVNIFRAGVEDLGEQAKDIMVAEPVFVEVPRGSVAFHHALTAHAARPNRTSRMREVHTMIFFKDGNTRSVEGQHHAVDRAAIKPGAPIASDVTPIAWPRADGDLPATPAPMRDIPVRWQRSGAFPVR
jgi:ectoine hydroxylase-related dioxygenase (phytanoyl-CoA dioxygenase family)